MQPMPTPKVTDGFTGSLIPAKKLKYWSTVVLLSTSDTLEGSCLCLNVIVIPTSYSTTALCISHGLYISGSAAMSWPYATPVINTVPTILLQPFLVVFVCVSPYACSL